MRALAAGGNAADAMVAANQSFANVLSERLHRRDIGVVLNTPEPAELRPSSRIRRNSTSWKATRSSCTRAS